MPTNSPPRFTLVCAVEGGDSTKLATFLTSVAAQTFDRSAVEVVLVVDEADVDSLTVAHSWAEDFPGPVQILSPGDASALRTGAEAANGEWISFPHPLDTLAPKYLTAVDRFLTGHPDTDLVTTRRLIWNAVDGTVARTHPLRRFYPSDGLVDLADSDSHFCDSANAAFFPADRLRELPAGPRLGAIFDSSHLVATYLLDQSRPQVGFLHTARYFRRKPAPGSPGREPGVASVPRPTALFAEGYRGLVTEARARFGEVPDWLRRQLAFEVARFVDSTIDAPTAALPPGEDPAELHRQIAALAADVDLVGPLATAPYPVSRPTKVLLSSGYGADATVEPVVRIDKIDPRLGLLRARYCYTGAAPSEQARHADTPVAPIHSTIRTIRYLDLTLVRERIVWIAPDENLSFALNGKDVPLLNQITTPTAPPDPQTPEGIRAAKAAGNWLRRRQFKDAWVFMDKIHAARDNAEHLFGYVRDHHPEINAYFVIEEGTACWYRLRAEHGRRVVAHGSHRWRVLMAHCTEYVSSHCDAAVLNPPALLDFMTPSWRFSLIDHGVRKDDSSPWLNRRPLDLIVTTTPAETEFMVGESGFVFTDKEVVQSGMPRLDRLLALGHQVGPAERHRLLIAPTWRNWLVPPLDSGSQRRGLVDEAIHSRFVRAWTRLLTEPALADLCVREGLDLTLLPHPNLEALLPELDLPGHITTITYSDTDIQQVFAETRLLVTDYSSVAFDLAYIDRPVLYYQFDAEEFRSGKHTFRPGYFLAEEHGFGPAPSTHEDALAAIIGTVEAGPLPVAPYDARISATFPDRDGQCCARTLAGIRRGLN